MEAALFEDPSCRLAPESVAFSWGTPHGIGATAIRARHALHLMLAGGAGGKCVAYLRVRHVISTSSQVPRWRDGKSGGAATRAYAVHDFVWV